MKINEEIFSNKEKAMFALRQLYAKHGFSMYRMSKFEEFGLYAENMDFLDSGQIITFTDTDGMLMALKPDVTLSIVKNNRHIGNRIIKLYYNENIYRVSPKTRFFKEIMQVGLECLGAVDDACISEVLLLAAESMKVLSDEAKLDVSNLDILTQLFESCGVLIDLTKHEGGHPRMGCVDVIPFVPIKEATTEECIELSKRVGERIAEEADLPVFLYEESATAKHRQNLAKIRKGQFEGMAEKVKEEKWCPDFGGARIHPTGGVVAVGARPPLIAFNINLATDNVEIAKNIANIIREVKGGFKCVKAMGLLLEDRNVAQVSINMTNFNITPLHRVLELVRREAARYGVNVIGTEVIGLAPMKAFFDAAEYYLQIEDFDPDVQVIENHLL